MAYRSLQIALIASYVISLGVAQVANVSSIQWKSCPDVNEIIAQGVQGPFSRKFDCANLTVPLDYTDPNSKPLTLNVFKLNATQQPAKGSVIINFGGPGGTGAENLPFAGVQIGKYIGEEYDLVTWDPRGTGRTIPFNCNVSGLNFPSTIPQKRDLTLVKVDWTEIILGDATASGWSIAGQVANACYNDNQDLGRFISSASTAKDVMAIVDALNEDGLLRYWGWSYGTALGSYIAKLYPDRIERMVLDGNLNPLDYQSGTYHNAAHDVDKAFQGFVQECFKNKNACALAKYTNAQSVDNLFQTVNTVLKPLAVDATDFYSYFLGVGGVEYLINEALYTPATWPNLAYNLTVALQSAVCQTNNTASATTTSSANTSSPSAVIYNLGDPWNAFGIRGADAIWQTSNKEDFRSEVEYEANLTSIYLDYLGAPVSAQWKITPKDRYYGDFHSTTKTPILYVNGRYDPITPIIGAYNASQGFPGSVVLAHDGYGHGVIRDDSDCVKNYTNAYFMNGSLPPAGTLCQSNNGPWALATAIGIVPDISQITAGGCDASANAPPVTGTGGSTGPASNSSSPTPGSPTTTPSVVPSSGASKVAVSSLLVVALSSVLALCSF